MRKQDKLLTRGELSRETRFVLVIWRQEGERNLRRGFHYTLMRSINERGRLEQELRRSELAIGGPLGFVYVTLVRSGHDCDCSSYVHRTRILSPRLTGLFQWQRSEEDRHEWLDGPESTYFERPGLHREGHWSRDCALESYEETGRMGTVSIQSPDGA